MICLSIECWDILYKNVLRNQIFDILVSFFVTRCHRVDFGSDTCQVLALVNQCAIELNITVVIVAFVIFFCMNDVSTKKKSEM